MRVKSYLLAASLCCMLPFMAQGVDLDDKGQPEPGPRVARRSITPIVIETESVMFTVHFISNFGEVYVLLQEATGIEEYCQSIDTSVKNQAVLAAPAGTYLLTIFGSAGNVIHQESVFIP